MKNNKKVSVVIPNYNGQHLLKKNLPMVLKSLRDQDELVIVDDHSTDKSVEWVVKKFDLHNQKINLGSRKIKAKVGSYFSVKKKIRVVLVVNQKNIRFAKAVNKGVIISKNNLIFLLNNDVSPEADTINQLVKDFDKDVFAVGCLEIEKNMGGIKAGKNTLEFKRGMFIHSRADDFLAGPTAWASGGSAMFDKKKWLQLDGLDSLFYPAYWEDIDLSFRAKKKGWLVLFEPKAKVDHNHETTNNLVFGQKQIDQMSWQNAKKFVLKHANWWQRLLFYLWRPYWWIKVERKF